MNFTTMNEPEKCRIIAAVADIAHFFRATRNKTDTEVFAFLDTFYEKMGDVLEGTEGHIVKFMGDAAFIIFPEKIGKEAVNVLHSLKETLDPWLQEQHPAMKLFIKAHVGSAICGNIGTRTWKQFDVIGFEICTLFTLSAGEMALSPALTALLEADS